MQPGFDRKAALFTAQLVVLGMLAAAAAAFGWQYADASAREASARTRQTAVLPIPVSAATPLAPIVFSTSTPKRTIEALRPDDVVPATGKFILADLSAMQLTLYQDGIATATLPIKTKGRPGTAWETPSGFYAIQTKEENHFSTIGRVNMPFSMQFYGNYFIHGWTTYLDGTPTPFTFSGGCIKLETDDAEKVFAFADVGTKLFVYDPPEQKPVSPLGLGSLPVPRIHAEGYLVADMDTGDVYTEAGPRTIRPIASLTKLMTALVANETISFDKRLTVFEGYLTNPRKPDDHTPKQFVVGDLLYPLLMQSSNHVADTLASYYGRTNFVHWMNTEAEALDMHDTHYEDPSGLSPDNVSTPDDLFRLASYIARKKSFIWKITKTPDRTITARDGSSYLVKNVNAPATSAPFEGGKIGYTDEAEDTMVSVLTVPAGETAHRIVIIVLGSDDHEKDTSALAHWMLANARSETQTACASCAAPQYRRIRF
jgi:D-alanyl-D-alanine endopeptidase (penicillin-binding protein 7)